MQSQKLTEYRCSCGKLLFKGLLLSAIVETKCRRCGEILQIKSLDIRMLSDEKVGFLSDATGRILLASSRAADLFGYELSELHAMRIEDLFVDEKTATKFRCERTCVTKHGEKFLAKQEQSEIPTAGLPCTLYFFEKISDLGGEKEISGQQSGI